MKPGGSGDGSSPSAPYGALDQVPFGALPDGAVVALAKGTYDGARTLNRTVTLWGACAAFAEDVDPHLSILNEGGPPNFGPGAAFDAEPGAEPVGCSAEDVVDDDVFEERFAARTIDEDPGVSVAGELGAPDLGLGPEDDDEARPQSVIGGAALGVPHDRVFEYQLGPDV